MIDIEADILDFDENKKILDIRINPDVYIHYALISAQKALLASTLKANINDGILAYSVLIEQIETICVAADYLKHGDYENDLKAFESKLGTDIEQIYKMAKIANFKLESLLRGVIKRKPNTSPLRDVK